MRVKYPKRASSQAKLAATIVFPTPPLQLPILIVIMMIVALQKNIDVAATVADTVASTST